MSIEIDVAHRLGDFSLDLQFRGEGRLIALFGRSGAGKTSLVKIIAGLIRPMRGRVAVEDQVLLDTERGIFVPKHKRRIGYVFQEGRLFPHLTARQNLLYGRWFMPRRERQDRLAEVVALLGIEALLDRRPAHLSGGEQQRVAIGRALLAQPRLLLMDEPLASLDAPRKMEILPYIERLRDEAGVPIVYVSHVVAEVARLATTVVVISDGRIEAVGPIGEITSRPDLSPLLGRFEAGSVIETRIAGHDEADMLTRLSLGAGNEIRVQRLDGAIGTKVRLRMRARDIMLATERPSQISALNMLRGRVAELVSTAQGPAVDVRLELAGEEAQSLLARVTRRSATDLGLAPGREVFAILKTVAIERRSLGGVTRMLASEAEEVEPEAGG